MTTGLLLLAMTASLLALGQRLRGLGVRSVAALTPAAGPKPAPKAPRRPAEASPPRRRGRDQPRPPVQEPPESAAPHPRAPLGPLVDRAIAAALLRAGRPGLRHWLVEPALRHKVVLADPAALQAALSALLRRAVKHSREDDIIALRWISGSARAAIVVEDEGDGLFGTLPGQAAEDRRHADGPSGGVNGNDGSALGDVCELDDDLREARRFVAPEGGDVRFEAAPGIGARTWLTLPRERVLEAA